MEQRLVVMDGQGGGVGRALIERLRAGGYEGFVLAVGTNAAATAAMARAVAESPAQKVLVPVSRCGVQVAGLEPKPLGGYIADAAELILKQCRGGTV